MSNVLTGTDFHDVIIGTDEDDIIDALAGYDILDGGGGSDTYLVNADDFQGRFVNFYNDTGTSGTDVILATSEGIDIGLGDGFSLLNSGIEVIDGLANARIIGDNDNQIWDFSGVEIIGVSEIFGNGGRDQITGSDAADVISGGSGHDVLFGGLGADTLNGGTDSDHLFGEEGRDTLFGDVGNDILDGGRGHDTLDGGEGHDLLEGGNGRDIVDGGDGHDQLFGGNGRDALTGGAGFDFLDGGEGQDIYFVGTENAGYVDEYSDSGTRGRDTIAATEDNTIIGLKDGFGPDSGIEIIDGRGFDNVTIGGTNDAENWDFSNTRIRNIDGIFAGDG